MRFVALLSVVSLLAACGESAEDRALENVRTSTEELSAVNDEVETMTERAKASSPELSDADRGRVCRAAIASLNGRDPAIIRVISTSDDIHRVRYTRDDGTVWTNECRVGNGTAEWRMVENGQPGRWRSEDTIRFTADGSTISIDTSMGGEPMTSDVYEVN